MGVDNNDNRRISEMSGISREGRINNQGTDGEHDPPRGTHKKWENLDRKEKERTDRSVRFYFITTAFPSNS